MSDDQGAGPRIDADERRVAAANPGSSNEYRARMQRSLAWLLVWALPVVVTIVGIVLTSQGSVMVTDQFDENYVFVVSVWPAGLTLLGAGLLGLMAASIVTLVHATRR